MKKEPDKKKIRLAVIGIIILFALLIFITMRTSIRTYQELNAAIEEMSIDIEE